MSLNHDREMMILRGRRHFLWMPKQIKMDPVSDDSMWAWLSWVGILEILVVNPITHKGYWAPIVYGSDQYIRHLAKELLSGYNDPGKPPKGRKPRPKPKLRLIA